jgi:ADP-ribosylglycohydrolase
VTPLDRARGALYGLAIGDALGMPTQMLSRPSIAVAYGIPIRGFEPAPPNHPIAAGQPAGAVTDDTEQAVLVGRLLVAGGGHVEPARLAHTFLEWEKDMIRRGSLDLLGPSTKRAVAAVEAGVAPSETGREGDTNGAAMRIAPVGLLCPVLPAGSSGLPPPGLAALVDRVVEVSMVTHNTGIALSGAAAVAAFVSAAVSGSAFSVCLGAALAAASLVATRGTWVAGASVAARIEWAVSLVAGLAVDQAMETVYRLVGTSLATQESVPAAFAVVARLADDPWEACRQAASLGGDCDTIGAMAGAMLGALSGLDAFPPSAISVIAAHDLGLDALAADLLALRASGSASAAAS